MTVVVVGAGVAGLVTARDLAGAGLDVVVLDPAPPGGCLRAHEVGDLVLDAGAESFATRSPVVAGLLDELGLADDVVLPRPGGAWVHLPSGTVPLPATGALGIPGSVWGADVRRAVGTAGTLRASFDRWLPAHVGLEAAPGRDASLGALVRTRMGRRVLDRLVAPVVSGVHATHPDDADVEAVLPGLADLVRRHGSLAAAVSSMRRAAPAGSAVAGLRGGMHRLVTALVADLAAQGVPVLRAGATGLVRDGDRWTVLLDRVPVDDAHSAGAHGGAAALGADAVVVATPGPAAGALLAPDVPAVTPLALAGPRVVLATLVLDAPALGAAPRGTGVLVADGTGVRAKALTHATAKWAWLAERAGGRHVVRLSYSPVGDDDPAEWEQDRLVDTARADAATLLGTSLQGAVTDAARTVWSQGLPRTAPGRQAQVQAVRADLARTPGLAATGAWVAGTGLVSVVADARRCAREVIAAAM